MMRRRVAVRRMQHRGDDIRALAVIGCGVRDAVR